jgi:hypothetical protein
MSSTFRELFTPAGANQLKNTNCLHREINNSAYATSSFSKEAS